MAFITQYMTGDQRIQLGRESYVRKFIWGTGWRKIKIGLFWAVNDPLTSIYGAGLKVGIAAGSAYGYDSPNIVDYIGYQHGGSWLNGSTLTRVTSNGQPAFAISANVCARKVGPTVTFGNSNSASGGYVGVVNSGILTAYIVTITKLNNGYDLAGYCYGNSGLAQLSRIDLIASCESDTLVNSGNWGNLASASPTIAYDGSQPFDSLCISWTLSTPTVEIGEIIVTRHY